MEGRAPERAWIGAALSTLLPRATQVEHEHAPPRHDALTRVRGTTGCVLAHARRDESGARFAARHAPGWPARRLVDASRSDEIAEPPQDLQSCHSHRSLPPRQLSPGVAGSSDRRATNPRA